MMEEYTKHACFALFHKWCDLFICVLWVATLPLSVKLLLRNRGEAPQNMPSQGKEPKDEPYEMLFPQSKDPEMQEALL